MKILSLNYLSYSLVWAMLLTLCVLPAWPADEPQSNSAQQLDDDPEAEAQEELAAQEEAGEQEELAAQEEDAERQREAQQRRRRGPNIAKLSFGERDVIVQYSDWAAEGPDYEQIDGLQTGEILEATLNAALKLKTDTNLKAGNTDVVLKTENVAKDYPGVYSMWIRKTEDGWSLIFNEKADVWGTMHDPESDVGEIPLGYNDTEEPNEMMVITLEERDGGAMLRIHWGKHQWMTALEPIP